MTRFLLFLRRSALEGESVKSLREAAGISGADAERILRSEIPTPVAVEDSLEASRGRLRCLRAAGLDAFAVAPRMIREFAPIPVLRAEPRDAGISWEIGGASLLLGPDDVRMILIGTVRARRESRTVAESSPGASVAVGLLLTGLPIYARGTAPPERVETTRSEAPFCLLFRSRREAYRLDLPGFDFRSLLPSTPPTLAIAFRRLVEALRRAYPQASFDDGLFRRPLECRMLEGQRRTVPGPFRTNDTRMSKGSTANRVLAAAYIRFLQVDSPGTSVPGGERD